MCDLLAHQDPAWIGLGLSIGVALGLALIGLLSLNRTRK